MSLCRVRRFGRVVGFRVTSMRHYLMSSGLNGFSSRHEKEARSPDPTRAFLTIRFKQVKTATGSKRLEACLSPNDVCKGFCGVVAVATSD